MNNLEKIQKAMYVFLVLSKIALAMAIFIALISALFFTLLIAKAIDANALLGVENDFALRSLASCSILMLLNAIIAFKAKTYFKSELIDGTPFSTDGAKRVKNIGILLIAITIVSSIVSALLEIEIDETGGIVLGLGLILLSFLLLYGSELEGHK